MPSHYDKSKKKSAVPKSYTQGKKGAKFTGKSKPVDFQNMPTYTINEPPGLSQPERVALTNIEQTPKVTAPKKRAYFPPPEYERFGLDPNVTAGEEFKKYARKEMEAARPKKATAIPQPKYDPKKFKSLADYGTAMAEWEYKTGQKMPMIEPRKVPAAKSGMGDLAKRAINKILGRGGRRAFLPAFGAGAGAMFGGVPGALAGEAIGQAADVAFSASPAGAPTLDEAMAQGMHIPEYMRAQMAPAMIPSHGVGAMPYEAMGVMPAHQVGAGGIPQPNPPPPKMSLEEYLQPPEYDPAVTAGSYALAGVGGPRAYGNPSPIYAQDMTTPEGYRDYLQHARGAAMYAGWPRPYNSRNLMHSGQYGRAVMPDATRYGEFDR